MKKNKTKIFIIFLIIIMCISLIGLTYAYYKTRIVGNNNSTSIAATSKVLEIKYKDGISTINGNSLNGEYNDFIPGDVITKEFSVENTGDGKVSYKVVLEDLVNTFTRKEDLKLSLTCDKCNGISGENYYPEENAELVENTINSGETHNYILTIEYVDLPNLNQSDDMDARLNGKINIIDNESKIVVGTLANAKDGDYVIVESTPKRSEIVNGEFKVIGLDPGNHNLTLYDKDDNELGSYSFLIEDNSKRINVNRTNLTFELKDASSWDVTAPGTLLAAIKRDNVIEEPKTNIGDASSEDEAVLAKTEDDYGDSYYFRGNVQNNFVTFSGMCFRILRVLGDGNIKLVLADSENPCGPNSDDGYSTENANSGLIENTLDYYEGYEHSDFLKQIDNKLLINAKYFNNLGYLDDWWVDECLGDPWDVDYGCSYEGNYAFINSLKSLKYDEFDFKGKTGVLSVYEILLTGGSTITSNSSKTLWININAEDGFLTNEYSHAFSILCIESWGCDFDPEFGFMPDKRYAWTGIIDSDGEYYFEYIRPTIVLSSSATITKGNGTQDNPYVVG